MFKRKLILAICAILLLIPTTAFAATDYTITVRAGSNNVKGEFTDLYKDELQVLQSSGEIKSYTFTPDKVTIVVPEGKNVPILPDRLNYIDIPSLNYYILPVSDWGYSKNQGTISRNEDIVVQYGSLIDGIEYTVYYLEKGTTRNVALPLINRVEATTTTVSASAITINGYSLDAASPASQTITLNPSTENKIVFEYNYVGPGSTTTSTTETTYTAGGVTTTFLETEVPTYVATPTAGGGAGGGGAAAGGEAGGAAAGGGAAADGGAVAIPDGDVPLAATPGEEGGSEETTIEDSEVPLASPVEQKTNWLVWIACILGAAVVITVTTYIGIRSRKAKAIDFSEEIKEELTDNHKKES